MQVLLNGFVCGLMLFSYEHSYYFSSCFLSSVWTAVPLCKGWMQDSDQAVAIWRASMRGLFRGAAEEFTSGIKKAPVVLDEIINKQAKSFYRKKNTDILK